VEREGDFGQRNGRAGGLQIFFPHLFLERSIGPLPREVHLALSKFNDEEKLELWILSRCRYIGLQKQKKLKLFM